MNSAKVEGNLVEGKSYTAKWTSGKEYLGKYDGIVNVPYTTNIHQTIGIPTDVHSFPERKGDSTKYFPLGHFDKYGVTFEEGDTVVRGGRRAPRSRRRQSRRRQSRRRQSRQ